MKLEVGKRYQTQDGRAVIVLEKKQYGSYPFHGQVIEIKQMIWTDSGECSDKEASDIVAKWPENRVLPWEQDKLSTHSHARILFEFQDSCPDCQTLKRTIAVALVEAGFSLEEQRREYWCKSCVEELDKEIKK